MLSLGLHEEAWQLSEKVVPVCSISRRNVSLGSRGNALWFNRKNLHLRSRVIIEGILIKIKAILVVSRDCVFTTYFASSGRLRVFVRNGRIQLITCSTWKHRIAFQEYDRRSLRGCRHPNRLKIKKKIR